MKTLQAILLVLSVAISVGCKKSEKKSTEPATPTTEKAPEAGAPTDTVCCDFDGQVGAATRSQCEGGKGKVLDKKPPC
jgi:hypothetical protein